MLFSRSNYEYQYHITWVSSWKMLCNIHFYKHYAERLTAEVGAWERMNIPIIAINWAGNHKLSRTRVPRVVLHLETCILLQVFGEISKFQRLDTLFSKTAANFVRFIHFSNFCFHMYSTL